MMENKDQKSTEEKKLENWREKEWKEAKKVRQGSVGRSALKAVWANNNSSSPNVGLFREPLLHPLVQTKPVCWHWIRIYYRAS